MFLLEWGFGYDVHGFTLCSMRKTSATIPRFLERHRYISPACFRAVKVWMVLYCGQVCLCVLKLREEY